LGKELENSQATLDFHGYTIVSSGLESALVNFEELTKTAGQGFVAGSVGLITLSSFCGTSVRFVTKMIQILEFTSLIELFNVNFDRILQILLQSIANLIEIDILDFPTEKPMNKKVENSIASQWKGKLS
jgi:hypothetical protein